MILFIILTAIYVEIILIFLLICLKNNRRRERLTLQSLYKLMEGRVLNRTLQNPISTQQAVAYEYQQLYLRVEFPDTKPWMAYLFSLEDCVTVGRSRENKISIQDARISRMHCKIGVQNGVLYLQDMGTANGTKIKRGLLYRITLQPQEAIELYSGDVIYLGRYRMKIRTYYGHQAVS